MSKNPSSTEKLEKQLRVLRRKLERSEWHRVDLENQHDRDQHLYRRLQADLEAARREAQVQLALERIRSQSSRMQHSGELVATSAVFHEQLLALGVPTEFSYVWLPDEAAGKHQFWATWTDEEDGEPVHRSRAITYDLDKSEPYTAACFAAWESDDHMLVDFIPPADITRFFEIWKEVLGNARHLRPNRFPDGLYYAEGYMQYGCFGINIRREPTEEERDILLRFAVEFERAYTRFLDLRHAEAQAREAQIEAALERVRSRAMAMQSSDELGALSFELVKQVQALGADTWHCAFHIYDEDEERSSEWGANADGYYPTYTIPRVGIFRRYYEIGQSGTDLHVEVIGEDRAAEHYEGLCTLPGVGDVLLKLRESGVPFPERQVDHVAYFKYGYLIFITYEPAPEAHDVFRRFAKVFEQTYTRFLDLKRSEEQAREAQIEAALERVRARTMAMQSSDELQETSALLFAQIKELGIETWTSGFNIWEEDERACIGYNATPAGGIGVPIRLPLTEDPFFQTIFEAKKRGDDFLVFESEGESLAETYRYMFTLPVVKDVMQGIVDSGFDLPEYQVTHCGFFSHGHLMFITLEPRPEAWDIFKRFTKVFEQTYTRFLDLRQAEARSREAQIEAAMERVRSRALAMTSSDELLDVVFKIRKEFARLGLECGAFWHTRYTPECYQKALTSLDGKKLAAVMELPRDFASNPDLAAWEHGDESVGVFPFDAEAGAEYMHHMATKGKFSEIDPEAVTVEMVREHGGITFVQARTSHGEIGYSLWGEAQPSEEAKDVLVRFASAFDLAYRRFEDLKQAEKDHQALLEEKALTEQALVELRATQAQLIQSEKMASLGALTAGIAHEIKNPLNFVTNFASLSQELAADLEDETDPEERRALLADLKQNVAKIEEHGRRADAIVRGMMEHARGGSGERRAVKLNALVEEYAAHALHATKVRHPNFAPNLVLDLDADIGAVEIAPQDIGRVLINLIDNALDATRRHAEEVSYEYVPTVTVSTRCDANRAEVLVRDNGPGMAAEVRAKVFEPFFTTKPTGEGTGLGLSLAYDIVTQGHGGVLSVESDPGKGAQFRLVLPAAKLDLVDQLSAHA